MQILLITDQHFGARNDNVALLDYFEKYYKNVVFPYIDKHNITSVIDLGDTFDRRKFVNYLTLHRSKKMWFDELLKRKIAYTFIVGNHTSYFRNTLAVNTPELLFGKYSWFDIISEPTEKQFGNTKVLLVPWICQDNEETSIKMIHETDAQVAFGHLEISGFEMYKGHYVDSEFDQSLFSKFDLVASGHLHHKSTRGNTNYLGCPYEITWSDYNDPKGFHIFDTETRELTFLENPYKLFHKVYYDDTGKTLEELLDFDETQYSATYVKIIVKERSNPYFFDTFFDKIERSSPINIEVIEGEMSIQFETDDDVIENVEDTRTFLSKYVEGLEIDTDKKALELVLHGLYSEALTRE